MDDKPAPPSREERLATKLRENLKRRKAQARALREDVGRTDDSALSKPGAES